MIRRGGLRPIRDGNRVATAARDAVPLAVAALSLLLAALGVGGRVGGGDPTPRRVLLVDVSPSVGADPASIVASLEPRLREAAAAAPGAAVDVIAFDGAPRPIALGGRGGDWEEAKGGLARRVPPGAGEARTDVAAAIDAALARIGGDPGDVVVFSDFAETRGDAVAAAARAAARGVPVHAAAVLAPFSDDARVASLDAPSSVPFGTPVELRATIAARLRGERSARVVLERDGARVGEEVVRLRGVDAASVALRDASGAAAGAVTRYALRVLLDPPDGERRNDVATCVVRTTGAPRVLVPSLGGAVAAALAERGFSVVAADPIDRAALAAADVVVVEESPLGAPGEADSARGSGRPLALAEAAAIADFATAGGCVVGAGARRAFGPGLWRSSPLEAVLPVDCGPRERPPLALLLVLDASGSMAAEGKLERARDAAASVPLALRPGDRAGLLAFRESVAAETPLLDRDAAAAAISRALAPLLPHGGTRLAAAVEEAVERLARARAEREGGADAHAIVLSDGLAGDAEASGREALEALARRAREAGVSLSVVATGTEIDAERLRALGNVAVARDPSAIGRLFLEDLGKRDLAPPSRVVTAGPGLDASASPVEPFEVETLARTAPKPRARVHYATTDGDPVVAEGPSGSGRAVAIPVDLEAGGGARVLALAADLVAERARAAAALRGDGISASFEPGPLGWRVTVRSWPAERPMPRAARIEPGGEPIRTPVEPLAPDRFAATLELPPDAGGAEGAPLDAVFVAGAGDEPVLRLALPALPPREFAEPSDPFADAGEVARAGGGRALPAARAGELPPPPASRAGARAGDGVPASALLAALALAILVGDAGLRALARRPARERVRRAPLTSSSPSGR